MLGNAPIGDRKRKIYNTNSSNNAGGGLGPRHQPPAPMMSLMMHQGPGQAPMPPHHQFGSSGNGQQMMQMPAIGAASGPAAAAQMGPGIGGPTCVLFVSEIPQNTCELELKRVFQEFGKLEQIQLMPAKGQALVEFLRLSDAERLMSMCQSGYIIAANGGNLTVCFANRQRIDQGLESYQSATPQTCLLLTFYNVRMDFNCESIRQICGPYGIVDRCLVVSQQDGLLRAVLEFEKLEDAVLTKPNLNGANMYAGCNAISCEYVRHTAFEYFASRHPVMEEYRYDQAGAMMMGGGPPAGKRLRMPPVQPLGAPVPAAAAAAAAPPALMMQPAQSGAVAMLPAGAKQPVPPNQHCVIVIRGLSPQMNCDRLFNILALYGNVDRIKFVTSREGFALVQMLDASSAQQAVDFLHGQTVLGSTLKVTHSDQGAVKRNTKDFKLADGTPAEKSYDTAKLNRFMNQEAVARNQASLGRTGRILYYWGCPEGTSEKTIRETLKLAGASNPTEVSPQNEKGTTGWITFNSVSDATDAICLANHSELSSNTKLKLAYAFNKHRDR
ncbi:hypothetical protein BOX15_Mlig001362g1 [Macrostomum lignano]|nr:hypothetical protein BOX15_Mlig001362g1 [Macrostomum lignano]